jgi:4-hydroxy-tetrahydrodipicolinate synthase
MVTPFDHEGNVDYDLAASVARYLVENGSDGLVVAGSTGEGGSLSDEEKLSLFRCVAEAVTVPVLAGSTSGDTARSVVLSREAASSGVSGILVTTPAYSRPSQRGIEAHFTAIAAASHLPVMLYDIPGRTGVPIATSTLLRLAEHPQIVANKDAKGDLFAAQQVMSRCELVYYSVDDALNLPLLSVGAVGAVSVTGHLVADRIAAMILAYESGDVELARELNDELVPVTEAVMGITQGVIAVKAALSQLGRPGGGHLRLPLLSISAEEKKALFEGLADGGVVGFAS